MSFKLPCRSIIDFDVDHLINYALIVSSEGDVTIYDVEKAIQAEALLTSSKLRLTSRSTVSHHKSLQRYTDEMLAAELKSVYPLMLQEEGLD